MEQVDANKVIQIMAQKLADLETQNAILQVQVNQQASTVVNKDQQ